MAQINIDRNMAATVVVVIIGAVVGLGLYSRVTAMESRVAEAEAAVERLEGFADQLAMVEVQIATVRADMSEIAASRDEILGAICRILERPLDQCGVAQPP